MSKRTRSANLTECEKILLLDLVSKYKHSIENKKTDAVSSGTKEEGWRQLTEEFNSQSSAGVKREYQQLKNALDNLKAKAKKAVANDKVEVHKTGGGTFVRQVTHTDEKVLELLGHRATPLFNPYDGDASYNSEAAFICLDDDINSQFLQVEDVTVQPALSLQLQSTFNGCATSTHSLAPFSISSTAAAAAAADVLLPTAAVTTASVSSAAATAAMPSTSGYSAPQNAISSTAAAAADVLLPTAAVTTASVSSAAATAAMPSTSGYSAPQNAVRAHRQWSSKSRRSSASAAGRRASQVDTRGEISALAQSQAAYYHRQQEIAEQQHQMFTAQHQKTMELLELQQQYYAAKLRKITEE